MTAERTAAEMYRAEGLGTRLKPLTDTMPKALVPYAGVPMIQSLLLQLNKAGFTRAVINVPHVADMLEEFVRSHDGFGLDVAFSDERDLLRDTGGGIRHAVMSGLLGEEPVLVHNVDIITSGIDLGAFCRQDPGGPDAAPPAASLLVSGRSSSRYLLTDSEGLLRGWMYPAKGLFKGTTPEAAATLQPHAFSGIHLLTPAALQLLRPCPEAFSIIDFYLSIAASHPVRCVDAPAGAVITDIGKLAQLR